MSNVSSTIQTTSVAYKADVAMRAKADIQLKQWTKSTGIVEQLTCTAYTDFRKVVFDCTSRLDDVLVGRTLVDGYENCKAYFYDTYGCSHKRAFYRGISYPSVKLGDKPNMRHSSRSRGIDDLMRLIKKYPDSFLNCTTLHKFREEISTAVKEAKDKKDSTPKVDVTGEKMQRLVVVFNRNISKLRPTQYKAIAQAGRLLASSITETLANK